MTQHTQQGVSFSTHHVEGPGDAATLSVSPAREPAAADRLPDLVTRAETAARDLDRLARTILDAGASGTQTATDLQERLRLGVRMLQAFDVQIQRGEQAGQTLAAQLGPQLQAFIAEQVHMQLRARIEAMLQQEFHGPMFAAAQQAEASIINALESLDARRAAALSAVDEYRGRILDEVIERVDARIDAASSEWSAAIEGLQRPFGESPAAPAHFGEVEARLRTLVSDAEQRIADLTATIARAEERSRDLEARSLEAADALLGTVGTASTLKELVSDEIREQRRLAAAAGTATREIQAELTALVERCGAVRAELSEILARSGAHARVAGDKGAERVRQSTAEDLRDFTQALRQLANRAEHTFAAGRFDEFSPAAPALEEEQEETPKQPDAPAGKPGTRTTLPIETRCLSAEILALDATNLLKAKPGV